MIIEEVDEDGETLYLIPATLRDQKNPEWMTWKEGECPYFHMYGRICTSNKPMNPSTFTKILHTTRKEFPNEKITFFQGGFYMKTERSHVLVEPTPSYTGFRAKLGILTARAGKDKDKIRLLIKEGGEYFYKVFIRICSSIMDEANASAHIKQYSLSLTEMLKKGDEAYYEISDVKKHYRAGREFIDHETAPVSDTPALLLTRMEMEVENKNTTVIIFEF